MAKLHKRLRWWIRDKDGHVVLGQAPNLPIMVGSLAAVVSVITPGIIRIAVGLVAFGALFTWGWLELFSGTTPLRRLLGGGFLLILLTLSVLLLAAVGA